MNGRRVLDAKRRNLRVGDRRNRCGPGVLAGRLFTGVVVAVPLVGPVTAVGSFWHRGIGWFDLGLALVLCTVTGLGISLGLHRLFNSPALSGSKRAFSPRCRRPAKSPWIASKASPPMVSPTSSLKDRSAQEFLQLPWR
jgi:hypothetical protein